MTFTVPQQGPPTTGGPTVVRRLGEVYAYTVRDHHTNVAMPDDYVGQSRNQPRRDLQHRGLAPERDGVVREKPWADRIVSVRIVESGMWTNAELDERERHWIRVLAPRLNHDDNLSNPNRIPIPVQHEQRKERDPNWVIPDWSRRPAPVLPRPETSRPVPRRSVWRWLAATRLVRSAKRGLRRLAPWLAVAVAVWVALLYQHVPPTDAALQAAIASGLLWAACRWLRNEWRDLTRPKARTRRAGTRRRTR